MPCEPSQGHNRVLLHGGTELSTHRRVRKRHPAPIRERDASVGFRTGSRQTANELSKKKGCTVLDLILVRILLTALHLDTDDFDKQLLFGVHNANSLVVNLGLKSNIVQSQRQQPHLVQRCP